MAMDQIAPEQAGRGRIVFFDALRGFTILSMVGFHAAYDAAYLYGFYLPWFTAGPFQDIWRASISWTFLFLAGWMTSFSRNNIKRACVYGAAAIAVWAATSFASVDTAVNFGILFCMAASTLLWAIASPLLKRTPALGLSVLMGVLFVLTLDVPKQEYAVSGLAWLGLPSPDFSSGDYYPLVPFAFLYVSGALGAQAYRRRKGKSYPSWMYRNPLPPLAAVGRLSLPTYLVHQPLLIALFETAAWLGITP